MLAELFLGRQALGVRGEVALSDAPSRVGGERTGDARRPTSGQRSRSPSCRRADPWRGPRDGQGRHVGRRDARRRCPTARGAPPQSASPSRPCSPRRRREVRPAGRRAARASAVRGAGEDRVHCPGADPRAEQLLAELHNIPARDAVTRREGRDGRLKTRAERALGDLPRQLGCAGVARSPGSAPAEQRCSVTGP